MRKYINLRTNIALGLIFAFLVNTFGPIPSAQANPAFGGAGDFRLPAPGVMVHLSPEFNPPILKGIKVHPDDPFRFDFILDKGDSQLSNGPLKDESTKLIKYFLASLTIPEKDLWVNLSPYEKDRIIPNSFGLTEMGRDLLAEDYMLKQITASLIYPDDEIGKKFWKRVYEEAARKFGTTNIPVNTFNKVWIVPEKAVVYENAKLGAAYVVQAKLKVMLEEDYLSLEKHMAVQKNDVNALGSKIIREIIIPALTKEVNEDKNFFQLRQVYNSLILASWYKKKIKDSILAQVYEDKNKIGGINIDKPQEKEKIYQQYLKAFKKGVFNYIKEEISIGPDSKKEGILPRKYFSGGITDLATRVSFVEVPVKQLEDAISDDTGHGVLETVDLAMTTLSAQRMTFNQSTWQFRNSNLFRYLTSQRFKRETRIDLSNGKPAVVFEVGVLSADSIGDLPEKLKELNPNIRMVATELPDAVPVAYIRSQRFRSIIDEPGEDIMLAVNGDYTIDSAYRLDIKQHPENIFLDINIFHRISSPADAIDYIYGKRDSSRSEIVERMKAVLGDVDLSPEGLQGMIEAGGIENSEDFSLELHPLQRSLANIGVDELQITRIPDLSEVDPNTPVILSFSNVLGHYPTVERKAYWKELTETLREDDVVVIKENENSTLPRLTFYQKWGSELVELWQQDYVDSPSPDIVLPPVPLLSRGQSTDVSVSKYNDATVDPSVNDRITRAVLVNVVKDRRLVLHNWAIHGTRPFSDQERILLANQDNGELDRLLALPLDERPVLTEFRFGHSDRSSGLFTVPVALTFGDKTYYHTFTGIDSGEVLKKLKFFLPTLDELMDAETEALQVSLGNQRDLIGNFNITPDASGEGWDFYGAVDEPWKGKIYRALIQCTNGQRKLGFVRLEGDDQNNIHHVFLKEGLKDDDLVQEIELHPAEVDFILFANCLGWEGTEVNQLLQEDYHYSSDLRHLFRIPFLNGSLFYDQLAGSEENLTKAFDGQTIKFTLTHQGRNLTPGEYEKLLASNGYERMQSIAAVDATKADAEKGGYYVEEGKQAGEPASIYIRLLQARYPVNTMVIGENNEIAFVTVEGSSGKIGANYWTFYEWVKRDIEQRFGWTPKAVFALDNGKHPSIKRFDGSDREVLVGDEGVSRNYTAAISVSRADQAMTYDSADDFTWKNLQDEGYYFDPVYKDENRIPIDPRKTDIHHMDSYDLDISLKNNKGIKFEPSISFVVYPKQKIIWIAGFFSDFPKQRVGRGRTLLRKILISQGLQRYHILSIAREYFRKSLKKMSDFKLSVSTSSLKLDKEKEFEDLLRSSSFKGLSEENQNSLRRHIESSTILGTVPDQALITTKQKEETFPTGGIDLTTTNRNLQTLNGGQAIRFHMDPALLARLQHASGFVPVIINVQPMTDLRMFLGLSETTLDTLKQ